jgi:hypothetical protein
MTSDLRPAAIVTATAAGPPSALAAVRQAIVARLVGDADLVTLLGGFPKVYAPTAPQGAAVPFVVYDGGAEMAWLNFRRAGSEITATLLVETTVAHFDQHEAIVSRLRVLLERVILTLAAPWSPATVTPEPGLPLTQSLENGVLICRRALTFRVRTMMATSS